MSKVIVCLLMGATLLLAACSADPEDTPANATEDGLAAGTQASEDYSKAGGEQNQEERTSVLPLNTGVYVREGASCSTPANADVRVLDARGFSGSETHECRTYVLSSDGDTYTVEQSCIDAPTGEIGRRTSDFQKIMASDDSSFTLTTDDGSTTFNYCPEETSPDDLQEQF